MLNENDQKQPLSLTLIGCGKMGQAMLEGWLKLDRIVEYDVVEPHPSDELMALIQQNPKIKLHHRLLDLYSDGAMIQSTDTVSDIKNVLFLAVKPQLMEDVLQGMVEYQGTYNTNKEFDIVTSIAAGVTLSYYETFFPYQTPIIRVMPNTPVAVGKGASVYCTNDQAQDADKEIIENLLNVLGQVHHLEDQELMHAVTALSGSGPAYIYALTESMEAAGIKAGLPDALAKDLARQTVIGAASLMDQQTQMQASDLRIAVTSPGGTTAAALEVLKGDAHQLDDLIRDAVLAAKKRSIALSEL